MQQKNGNRKNYVLDTNVLLHDPACIHNFKGNNVILPMVVLEEIDSLKSRDGLCGCQARQAVRELSLQSGLVVAAGGGTLLNAENARTFGANGVIVLLGASLAAVNSRLRGDVSRPLLQRPDREEAMRALYEKRLPVYRAAAEFEVPADGTPEETADAVLSILRSEV